MAEAAHLSEFIYVSRYTQMAFGLHTYVDGANTDPDGSAVTATLLDADAVAIFTDRPATRISEGVYEITLSSVETATPGTYELQWAYTTGGTPQTYVHPIEVGDSAPAYDSLNDDFKGVVDSIMWKFADLYDSPRGGPHLQVYFQTHYGRGRIAQIMRSTFDKINLLAQPYTSYSIDGPKFFPLDAWGGLLSQYTYIETLKHLIRSYTEQPNPQGVTVSWLDRRDYAERWRSILRDEQEDLDNMLEHFKMAHMGLGRPSVLVEGGAFGRSWVHRGMYMNPARPSGYARAVY